MIVEIKGGWGYMAHKILEEAQEMNDLLINKMEKRSSSNS